MYLSKLFSILFVAMGSYSLSTKWQEECENIPASYFFTDKYSRVTLAPNGQMVAYFYVEKDQHKALTVQQVVKGHKVVLLKEKMDRFFWSSNSKNLIYIRNKSDKGILSIVNVLDGVKEELAVFEGKKIIDITVSSKISNAFIVHTQDIKTKLLSWYRYNLDEHLIKKVCDGKTSQVAVIFNDSLEPYFCHGIDNDGGQKLYLRQNNKWKRFVKADSDNSFLKLLASTDDEKRVFIQTSTHFSASRLLRMDVDGLNNQVLFEKDNYDVDKVLLDPKTSQLLAVSTQEPRKIWHIIAQDFKTEFAEIAKYTKGDIDILGASGSSNRWLIRYTNDDRPASYCVYDRNTKKNHYLFHNPFQLKDYPLSTSKLFHVTAKDGTSLQGFLTLPKAIKKPKAVLFYFKKDPFKRHRWRFNSTVQFLANRGYAVVQLNYRGLRGYGKTYLNTAKKRWLKLVLSDIEDVRKHLIVKKIADPNKMGLYAEGYGAKLAAKILENIPKDFKAVALNYKQAKCALPKKLIDHLYTCDFLWTPYTKESVQGIAKQCPVLMSVKKASETENCKVINVRPDQLEWFEKLENYFKKQFVLETN